VIRTLSAWQAVHRTRTGLHMLLVCASASLALGDFRLAELGPLRFFVPVSALLLTPVLAGLAVALACDNTARFALPDPWSAKTARAVWLWFWAALAIAAANLGQPRAPDASVGAVVRNVLLHASLALILVIMDKPDLAWIPPVFTTLVTMLFGSPESEDTYPWWALLLRPETTPRQWAAVLGIFLLVASLYVCIGPRRSGDAATE